MSARELLEMAKHYLEEARELLERRGPLRLGREGVDRRQARDHGLALSLLGKAALPKGTSWRAFVREALVKAGLDEAEESKWASYYVDVRDRLHGDCFYGLAYEEEHRPLMEKAGDYVKLVEELLGQVKELEGPPLHSPRLFR